MTSIVIHWGVKQLQLALNLNCVRLLLVENETPIAFESELCDLTSSRMICSVRTVPLKSYE